MEHGQSSTPEWHTAKMIRENKRRYKSRKKGRGIDARRFKENTDIRTTDDQAVKRIPKEMEHHGCQSEKEQVRFHGATHY